MTYQEDMQKLMKILEIGKCSDRKKFNTILEKVERDYKESHSAQSLLNYYKTEKGIKIIPPNVKATLSCLRLPIPKKFVKIKKKLPPYFQRKEGI